MPKIPACSLGTASKPGGHFGSGAGAPAQPFRLRRKGFAPVSERGLAAGARVQIRVLVGQQVAICSLIFVHLFAKNPSFFSQTNAQ
jgi:hypothetical protein